MVPGPTPRSDIVKSGGCRELAAAVLWLTAWPQQKLEMQEGCGAYPLPPQFKPPFIPLTPWSGEQLAQEAASSPPTAWGRGRHLISLWISRSNSDGSVRVQPNSNRKWCETCRLQPCLLTSSVLWMVPACVTYFSAPAIDRFSLYSTPALLLAEM